MSRRRSGLLLSLLMLSVAPTLFALTVEEVSNELVCRCSCGLVLEACNHTGCGSAIPMRELVKQKVEAGESKEQILEYFVAQYGEEVLAAPTKRGFNLTVWIAPFAVIVAGAVLIALLVSLWVRRRATAAVGSAVGDVSDRRTEVEQRYERIFEEELNDFE